ncbi:hypothetical protein FNL55_07885 [Tardiphaga sp. vice352]|uniref:hypothetical protein n=1 Tax=unclassified Tardiphaga TaxID=2631404 RepID=UPI001163D9BC|nr:MULTISPECIES: hypothetical protein [unclassified Tardiphaga]QDM15878.1 hypothetical protein FNL53_08160 [Tardiphaga sp. vice278]QDM20978.1 hypothetical protein FIU28_07520 [Tardiphaga sp. vice154]QDM31223.1 hypothetical protein FNL55_07885 [Tardiphaga sp. vice352]
MAASIKPELALAQRGSFESELDPLIALCEKGLSVNKRKPVDLFLVLYFWFVFEALPRGVPSTIPSNDSKTKQGAPTKSPVFQLARLTMQPLLLLAEQPARRSRLKAVQLDRALLRIEGYRKMTDDQIIDRLRQAKEMQEAPDLEHFAREIEDGHYR